MELVNVAKTEKGGEAPARAVLVRPWLWVAALTVFAACLRAIGIAKGLWWDEIYFLMITVRHPLANIVTTFPADTQHPLYSILARLSVVAFGEHAWSLRLPALLFGVASIPVLYLLASSVASRIEALLATALLTVSYHHVWFSQNARGYTALAFWTLLSTYLLLRGIETGRRGFYLAYGAAVALGIYTHLTMMFLVAAHLLICACLAVDAARKGAEKWRFPLQGFLLGGALTLLFYAPILSQVRNFFLHRPSPMRAVSTPRWALWETVRGLVLGLGSQGVLLLAGVVVLAGAWTYFKQNRTVFAMFALPGAMTAMGAVLSRGTMYPRFYFFLIGFAVLILIRGVFVIPNWIGAPRLAAVLACALMAASAYSLIRNYRYPKQDYEGAIQFVDALKKDGEVVVTAGATTYPMSHYFAKPWESVETAGRLEEICRRGRPVWLVYTFPRYLEAAVPGSLEVIKKEFTVVRVFPGTVGDGDVFVAKSGRIL